MELVCKGKGVGLNPKSNKKQDSQTDLDPEDQGSGSASIWGSSSFEERWVGGFSHQAEDAKGNVPSLSGSVTYFPFLADNILVFKEEHFGRDAQPWGFEVPSPGSQEAADTGKGVGMGLTENYLQPQEKVRRCVRSPPLIVRKEEAGGGFT